MTYSVIPDIICVYMVCLGGYYIDMQPAGLYVLSMAVNLCLTLF